MRKIAIYGKGGIGKSTTTSNLSMALTNLGCRVLQVGCDPKADSTLLLMEGRIISPVLEALRQRQKPKAEDLVHQAPSGVFCVECGGPIPGQGCAGRGIGMVLEFLASQHVAQALRLDVILFDVLGDVVCGGFAVPMRNANHVLIQTSAEKMALYAAHNIAKALAIAPSYAKLAGFLALEKDQNNTQKIAALAEEFQSNIIGTIPYDVTIPLAEAANRCVVSFNPESAAAQAFRQIAQTIVDKF
ncbi:MAG: AAA family ATPase [Desulfovibrio sp.]|nr:AAA family ATPase [Desulfovibrio sp.]